MDAQTATMPNAVVGTILVPSDEHLIAQAKKGHIDAFEVLFTRYRTIVFRYAYQMAGNRDDADDITQECFVRALENIERFRDECRFTTWLLRIATNLTTDKARMRIRRSQLLYQEAKDRLAWMTADPSADPVATIESRRKIDALYKALYALPIHHRTVIILRDFQELEYDNIAEILNCSIGGAKLRVLRGRKALRERLAPLLEQEMQG